MTSEDSPVGNTIELSRLLEGWTLFTQRVNNRDGVGQWSPHSLHYSCVIHAPTKGGTATWSGFYSVGSAIPVSWAKTLPEGDRPRIAGDNGIRRRLSLKELQSIPLEPKRDTNYTREAREACAGAYRPELLDVISSLLMDASLADLSFREWVDELGGDLHPADALETYHECVRSREFITKALGPNFDRAQELAADL